MVESDINASHYNKIIHDINSKNKSFKRPVMFTGYVLPNKVVINEFSDSMLEPLKFTPIDIDDFLNYF